MAAKKVAAQNQELAKEVENLQNEVTALEAAATDTTAPAEVQEEKKSLKEKAHEWGVKHPKITKAAKAVGVGVVGVVGGVIGYALGRDSVDVDLVDRLMDGDDDIEIID